MSPTLSRSQGGTGTTLHGRRTWSRRCGNKLGAEFTPACFARFAARFSYVRGDLQDVQAYQRLLEELGQTEDRCVLEHRVLPCRQARGFRRHRQQSGRRRVESPARPAPHSRGETLRRGHRQCAASQSALAPALRRAADLPHRPLPGQGERSEPSGLPLRQPDDRAAVEPQFRRPCADHGRRAGRHRDSRRLLRQGRRHARHAAEPSDAAADAGGDGTAGSDGSGHAARRKSEGASLHPSDLPGRGPRIRRASPIRARQRRGPAGNRLSRRSRCEQGFDDRNLRRRQIPHRQLALARGAVLPAHRKTNRQNRCR